MSNDITINEHGAVYSGLIVIGEIKGDKCLLYKRPGPKVYAAIKAAAKKDKLAFDIAPENAPAGVPPLPPAAVSIPTGDVPVMSTAPSVGATNSAPTGAQGDPATGSVMPSETPSEPQAGEAVPAVSTPAKSFELEPKQDPERGCKDPAWLAWKARQ